MLPQPKKRACKRPNGESYLVWVQRYKDAGGKWRLKTFERQKEAIEFRTTVSVEVRDNLHVPDSETATVAAACKLYLQHAERRHRDGEIGDTRLRLLRSSVNRHIVPVLGAKKLNRLTFAEVEQLHVAMRAKGLKPVTAKAYLTNLALIETYARKRGLTKQRVVSDVCSDIKGAKSEPVRTFMVDDITALLVALEKRTAGSFGRPYYMMRLYIFLAAACGLRYGEICGLTLDHVDFASSLIRIRHNLTDADRLKGPKSAAGLRDYWMPQQVVEALREYLDDYYEENPRRLVFRTRFGNRMRASNFHTHQWRPLLERAGLPILDDKERRFHFHALRHFNASLLVDNQVPLPVVARMLGHSTVDMTLRVYAHAITRDTAIPESVRTATTALLPSPRHSRDLPA